LIPITRTLEYALIALSYLSQRTDERPVSAKGVARACDLNEQLARKVLKRLAMGGLVRSAQGARGGYCPACPLADLSVLEVAAVVDGNRCRSVTSVEARSAGGVADGGVAIAAPESAGGGAGEGSGGAVQEKKRHAGAVPAAVSTRSPGSQEPETSATGGRGLARSSGRESSPAAKLSRLMSRVLAEVSVAELTGDAAGQGQWSSSVKVLEDAEVSDGGSSHSWGGSEDNRGAHGWNRR